MRTSLYCSLNQHATDMGLTVRLKPFRSSSRVPSLWQTHAAYVHRIGWQIQRRRFTTTKQLYSLLRHRYNSSLMQHSFVHVCYLQRKVITQDGPAVAGVNSLLGEGVAKLQIVHLVLLRKVSKLSTPLRPSSGAGFMAY